MTAPIRIMLQKQQVMPDVKKLSGLTPIDGPPQLDLEYSKYVCKMAAMAKRGDDRREKILEVAESIVLQNGFSGRPGRFTIV